MAIRTLTQNKAMWKLFELIAQELGEHGLDMKRVLKPEIDIPWTKQSVHDFMWIPILKAMTGKDSTKDMTTKEIDEVFEVLNRHLATVTGLHIPFPSIDSFMNNQLSELKEAY